MSSRHDLIVVGAGINGMTAAILAARQGRRVLLLERRSIPGGLAAAETFHPGFSCGLIQETIGLPSTLLRRLKLDPRQAHIQPGPCRARRVLTSEGSLEFSAEGIAGSSVDEDQQRALREFFAFIARTEKPLLRMIHSSPADPIVGEFDRFGSARLLWSLRRLGRGGLLELLRVPPMAAADWLGEWFDDGRIMLGLAVPALLGEFAAPRAPGTAALVLLREIARRGSTVIEPTRLVRAMVSAIATLDIELRCDHELTHVELDDRGVSGVVAGGESFAARQLIATCDPRQLFTQRLPSDCVSDALREHFVHYRCRGTLARMRVAVDGEVRHADSAIPSAGLILGEGLTHLEQAFDPVKYGELPVDPVLHVHVPSDRDPQLAPAGKSVLSIQLCYAPHSVANGARLNLWRDSILDRLERALPSLHSKLLHVELELPHDLEQRFGCSGGHVQHGELGLDQLLVRPAPQCARYATPIRGLYLGGRGSHPGPFGEGVAGSLAAERAFRESRPQRR